MAALGVDSSSRVPRHYWAFKRDVPHVSDVPGQVLFDILTEGRIGHELAWPRSPSGPIVSSAAVPHVLPRPDDFMSDHGVWTHSIEGYGEVLCHAVGIVEPITQSIWRMLGTEDAEKEDGSVAQWLPDRSVCWRRKDRQALTGLLTGDALPGTRAERRPLPSRLSLDDDADRHRLACGNFAFFPMMRESPASKVGKLFKASKSNRHAEIYPLSNSPNDIVFDYTADGVRRSIEDSLQRLGVDSLDIAFVHDISPDFAYFPNGWEEQYEIACKGAFPALSKMRDEGIIRAWGIGVNTPQPILKVMDDADPDVCLCARQYSLIDHADAANKFFPAVRKKNISLVIGSSLNAGFISGSPRYNYGKENFKIPAAAIEKREKLRTVAARYGVDLRTVRFNSQQRRMSRSPSSGREAMLRSPRITIRVPRQHP